MRSLHGGLQASRTHYPRPDLRPATLPDARLAAWATLAGERRQADLTSGEERRPHRGMLPDIDFSMVVPDPGRRSLLRRAVDLIRRALRRPERVTDPDAAASGSMEAAVAAPAPATYSPSAGDGSSRPAETIYPDVRAA